MSIKLNAKSSKEKGRKPQTNLPSAIIFPIVYKTAKTTISTKSIKAA